MLGGLGLTAMIGLSLGCGPKARVQNVHVDESAVLPRPGRILVFDFETGASDVRVGRSSGKASRASGLSVDDAGALAEAVADALAAQLVDDIRTLGLVAERANGTVPPAMNDVVIQGRFLRIDEGSAVKRFVIGFGAGATELRTQVEIFHLDTYGWRPIKQFDTVAQGSRYPGAAFGVAGGAAAGAVATSAVVSSGTGVIRELRASIDADARRTAEQIAAKVSELKTAQRW